MEEEDQKNFYFIWSEDPKEDGGAIDTYSDLDKKTISQEEAIKIWAHKKGFDKETPTKVFVKFVIVRDSSEFTATTVKTYEVV